MLPYLKKNLFFFKIISSLLILNLNAKASDINEILEEIQKDLRTLERAVYSESFNTSSKKLSNQSSLSKETEDALTRHLLKLSEIEKQFQRLTNRYEELNFKIDKLSSRLSKVQADNQLRFDQLENNSSINV